MVLKKEIRAIFKINPYLSYCPVCEKFCPDKVKFLPPDGGYWRICKKCRHKVVTSESFRKMQKKFEEDTDNALLSKSLKI